MFAHLHVHSCYSFMHGASRVEELVAACRRRSMTHLALTDTNGFYGLPNFVAAAREAGIVPIIGVHLTASDGEALLLALTPEAYPRLSELVSRCHLDPRFSLAASLATLGVEVAVVTSDLNLLAGLPRLPELYVEIRPGAQGEEPLHFARVHRLPPLATNAVYFAEPEDYILHRLLRAIARRTTLAGLPAAAAATPDQWLKGEKQMAAHFPHCPEAMENAAKLAQRCRADLRFAGQVFPRYGHREEDRFALLRERCLQGVVRRYGKMTPEVASRLEQELHLIKAKGFTDYFLVVADIVHRFPITCGRGSAAASLVSYLLGITHVDPIRHRLYFGRFLSPNRKDLPDIDVDFPWDERDKVFDFVEKTYGSERTAMVATHITFRHRAAVREVAKAFGMAPGEIQPVTRRLRWWADLPEMAQLQKKPMFKGMDLPPPWPEIIGLARRLQGIPRHLSVHCGGTIIVPDRVCNHVPVQRAPKGVRVIQWDKDQAEAAGLVKVDLLGNRSLAVIRDALAAVKANGGPELSYADLNPLDDEATRELLASGNTMGIFYVESPAMRRLQQMTAKGDYHHLVINSSIIRPAANRYIMEYVRRLHGGDYRGLHPLVDQLLADTYGIMVYQEDVSLVAMKLAGFSQEEAELLRKVLAKKTALPLRRLRTRFWSGCRSRGIDPKVIEATWEMITSFAGYSFCKPHSASYALVSFKAAYLKAHYPAEFMAAVLSNGGGYYSTYAYISEARRLGLKVLGPDVNMSEVAYTGRGNTLRVGLMQLRAIRDEFIQRLVKERRENGPFRSLEDLRRRLDPEPPAARILVQSGALDSLAPNRNRPQMLWDLYCRRHRDKVALFPATFTAGHVAPVADYDPQTRLQHERETLGFVLSVHPLAPYSGALAASGRQVVPAAHLRRYLGQRVTVAAWSITAKEVLTQEANPMVFAAFEDETAIFEATFFPRAYERYCQLLDMERPYLLQGKVEVTYGAVSLVVDHLEPLASPSRQEPSSCWRPSSSTLAGVGRPLSSHPRQR